MKLWVKWRPFDMSKGNKRQAFKVYQKVMATGVTLQTVGNAAMRYCDNSERRQVKTQHLSTWLNQRGWEQEEEPAWKDPMNRMPSPAGG